MKRLVIEQPALAILTATSINQVVATFSKWLYLPDPSALKVVLAAVAANLMPGDPLWLLLIGATGSGKTEMLDPLLGLPNTHSVSTMSEGSLLSGSAKRDKSVDSTGGLLPTVGPFGFLILKDFTSVLSAGREVRGPLLAALREIADGHWTRHVGVDGGRTLSWKGKVALLGGCTGAIDSHHALMSLMGERFLFFRLPEMDQESQADRAMEHVSHESNMRGELRRAVSELVSGLRLKVRDFGMEYSTRMSALATFAATARSAVERGGYDREIELILPSEMPGRLARSLRCLFQGMQNIGVSDVEAWQLIAKVALDCIPDLRRKALACLINQSQPVETVAVAEAIDYPTTTVRRVLEDVTGHGLVTRLKAEKSNRHLWQISNRSKQLLAKAQVTL